MQSSHSTGLVAAVIAFLTWGLYPLFFKLLSSVAPIEILAHRVLWSCLILAVGFLLTLGPRASLRAFGNRRNIGIAVVSASLISVNWFCFIYAVTNDQILEASLGYFLIPVVNALFGALFLGEALNVAKRLAVAVAFSGIAVVFLISGAVPVIALSIALSFGSYGMVRKLSPLDSPTGLFLETLLLGPAALGYIALFGVPLGAQPAPITVLLMLAGVMTLIPLLSMVIAARRLEYATLGFLQYLTPVTQFAIAVGFYDEPITLERLIAFGTVMLAVPVFLYGSLSEQRLTVAPTPN
ncbi:MAG: EamA family transporter RarD [Paracoccaceae bacterium]